MKSTRRLLYSAAVGTGLIFCGGAQAEDWKDGTSSGYATWNR
jgi:hypothetical protein